MEHGIYLGKLRESSILENAYVISKIREFLSSDDYKEGIFDDAFNEIQKLIKLVYTGGLFALENYTNENKTVNMIVQEHIKLILAPVLTPTEPKDITVLPALILIPKILYSDLTPVEFIKTVLLYEAIMMICIGGNSVYCYIDDRLKSVVRK